MAIRVGSLPYNPAFDPYQVLFASSLEHIGVEVVRIPNRRWWPIQHALRQPIDLLHVDWPHSFYTGRDRLATCLKRWMYFMGLRRLRRFPLVWTMHNLVAHDAANRRDELDMVQRFVDCCAGIKVMSHASEELLRATYSIGPATRVAVIPLGHYLTAYPNRISRPQARARLDIPADARVTLALGRICGYKGYDRLIRAFAKVAEAKDLLLIAGRPESRPLVAELERLAESFPCGNRIRIKPIVVPYDEVQTYLNACDLVAMPYQEVLNSGGAMLAMTFGRCMVGPRAGSIPEVAFAESFFGYEPDDPGGLEEALAQALRRTDLLERGSRAVEHVRTNFDWLDIAARTKELYEQVLASRK